MRKLGLGAKLWTQFESDEPQGCECCYNCCGLWHAVLFFFLFWPKWTIFEQPVETAVLTAWHGEHRKDSEPLHVVTPGSGLVWRAGGLTHTRTQKSFDKVLHFGKKTGHFLSLLCIMSPWGLFSKECSLYFRFCKFHSSFFLTNASLSPLHRSYNKWIKMQSSKRAWGKVSD